jgi:hypothetical protein
VSLARRDAGVRPVLTDEDGRFAIDCPDPCSAIVITKAGYESVVIEPDRRTVTRELDVRLERGAVMSGRIIEQGVPAIGARVVARRVDDASNTKPTYEAETDDLGEYRIGGLPPDGTPSLRTTPLNPYESRQRLRQTARPCRASSCLVFHSSLAPLRCRRSACQIRNASLTFAPVRRRAMWILMSPRFKLRARGQPQSS